MRAATRVWWFPKLVRSPAHRSPLPSPPLPYCTQDVGHSASAMKDLMKFEVGKLEGYTGPGLNEGGGGGGGGGSSMPFLIVIVLIAAIAYYFMTQKDE